MNGARLTRTNDIHMKLPSVELLRSSEMNRAQLTRTNEVNMNSPVRNS